MDIKPKYGLNMRLVDEQDAGFILGLRTDKQLSRFLTPTTGSLEDQVEWIRRYKEREARGEEYYFLFLDDDSNRLGVNRLYNFDAHSFEVGSWVFRANLKMNVAILGDLASRDFGFEALHADFCRFEVMKGHERVIRYHKNFHPRIVGQDDRAWYFRLSREHYEEQRDRLLAFIFRSQNI